MSCRVRLREHAASCCRVGGRDAKDASLLLCPVHPSYSCSPSDDVQHIFVHNFTGAPVSALPITDANRHLLQSGEWGAPGWCSCMGLRAWCC